LDDTKSPVIRSAYFPKLEDSIEVNKKSPQRDLNTSHDEVNRGEKEGSEYAISPRTTKQRYSHRDSQRNYFRRDQDNKILVNSLKKSDAIRQSTNEASEAEKKQVDE